MAGSTDSNMHNKRVTLRDVAREAGVSQNRVQRY